MHPTARWRALLVAAFAVACALCARSAVAQPVAGDGELERSVKAAYLYKFLGYVEWPAAAFASPAAPINVGVLGADDIATELARIVAGRKVDGRDIVVVALRRGEPPAGLHMLFVARSEGARGEPILRAAQAGSTLTVTDADGALDRGSVINFVRVGDNIRFEISLDAAERSGLKLSSRLLAVATVVRSGS